MSARADFPLQPHGLGRVVRLLAELGAAELERRERAAEHPRVEPQQQTADADDQAAGEATQ